MKLPWDPHEDYMHERIDQTAAGHVDYLHKRVDELISRLAVEIGILEAKVEGEPASLADTNKRIASALSRFQAADDALAEHHGRPLRPRIRPRR